jgi:hypothetical protein
MSRPHTTGTSPPPFATHNLYLDNASSITYQKYLPCTTYPAPNTPRYQFPLDFTVP